MKRFIAITVLFSVSILAVWVIFVAFVTSPVEAKTMLNPNYSGCVLISVGGADMKIAPVFDATGAIMSDPTGAILSVINP
jgi:hypothetical protein